MQGVLNWVGQPAPGQLPTTFEARLYDVLFKSPTPPDDWVNDLNPESLQVVKGAYASRQLAAAKPGDRWVLVVFCMDYKLFMF